MIIDQHQLAALARANLMIGLLEVSIKTLPRYDKTWGQDQKDRWWSVITKSIDIYIRYIQYCEDHELFGECDL